MCSLSGWERGVEKREEEYKEDDLLDRNKVCSSAAGSVGIATPSLSVEEDEKGERINAAVAHQCATPRVVSMFKITAIKS